MNDPLALFIKFVLKHLLSYFTLQLSYRQNQEFQNFLLKENLMYFLGWRWKYSQEFANILKK